MEVDIYKLEVMVLDFECYGEEEVKQIIENHRFLSVSVMSSKNKKIEWSYGHPINNVGTKSRAYIDLFSRG